MERFNQQILNIKPPIVHTRVDIRVITELERLHKEYSNEIEEKKKLGILAPSAADTYLLHSRNFVRWCKGDFEPGGRKKSVK